MLVPAYVAGLAVHLVFFPDDYQWIDGEALTAFSAYLERRASASASLATAGGNLETGGRMPATAIGDGSKQGIRELSPADKSIKDLPERPIIITFLGLLSILLCGWDLISGRESFLLMVQLGFQWDMAVYLIGWGLSALGFISGFMLIAKRGPVLFLLRIFAAGKLLVVLAFALQSRFDIVFYLRTPVRFLVDILCPFLLYMLVLRVEATKHYFAAKGRQRSQRRRRLKPGYIAIIMSIMVIFFTVFALRTETAFLAAFHMENKIATKIVALANVGKNAEYLTTVFRSGSTTDRKRAIEFARMEGTYSPELFAEFSNYLSNKDSDPAEILSLFATKSKEGRVISIRDVGVAYKGRIWQNCTFGNQGTACTGTPTFATWANASAKCRELRARGLQWDLPSTAQLDEITEDTEQVFDFHRLNTGDQIYWSNDQLKNEGKVKVVDFSKKTVFRAPLQNEYVFRCVGTIAEKK